MFFIGFQVKTGFKFFHVVPAAFGGVVGNVVSTAADAFNIRKQLPAAFVQSVPNGNRPVYIKQKQFLFMKHIIPPCLVCNIIA